MENPTNSIRFDSILAASGNAAAATAAVVRFVIASSKQNLTECLHVVVREPRKCESKSSRLSAPQTNVPALCLMCVHMAHGFGPLENARLEKKVVTESKDRLSHQPDPTLFRCSHFFSLSLSLFRSPLVVARSLSLFLALPCSFLLSLSLFLTRSLVRSLLLVRSSFEPTIRLCTRKTTTTKTDGMSAKSSIRRLRL